MHILLTRPLDDCKELILRFKSLGHKVSHLPVIKIQNVNYYGQVAEWFMMFFSQGDQMLI